MIDKNDGNSEQGTATKQAPSEFPTTSSSEPIGASNEAINRPEPAQPSGQNVERATKDLDSIRIAEWWLIGIQVCVLITGIVVCVIYGKQLTIMRRQLDEMKSGSTDTHELAVQAKNQADRTKDVADRALLQANATNELARQSKRSADEGDRSLAIVRNNFIRDQRPYVWFKPDNPQFEAGKHLTWNVHLVNSGRTPALKVRQCVAMWWADREVNQKELTEQKISDACEKTGTQSFAPIMPTEDKFVTGSTDVILTPETVKTLRENDRRLMLTGNITYMDMFGNKYKSTFCGLYLASGSVEFCAKHNDIK